MMASTGLPNSTQRRSRALLPSAPSVNPAVTHRHHKPRIQWLLFLLMAACYVAVASATSLPAMITPPTTAVMPIRTLVVDHEALELGMQDLELIMHGPDELRMVKRDGDDEDQSPGPSPTTFSTSIAPTANSSVTSTSTSTSAPEASSPLPSPLDSSSAFNFTGTDSTSCPNFVNDMLNSEEFKTCYPLSMLLQVKLFPYHKHGRSLPS